jgi:hypothetical protein
MFKRSGSTLTRGITTPLFAAGKTAWEVVNTDYVFPHFRMDSSCQETPNGRRPDVLDGAKN